MEDVWVYKPFEHKAIKLELSNLAILNKMVYKELKEKVDTFQYIDEINAYLFSHRPSPMSRVRANELLKPSHEEWCLNQRLNIFVSNLGRFKVKNNGEWVSKPLRDISGLLYFKHDNHKLRASDIVYETFGKRMKTGYHAYPINEKYNDIRFENLVAMTHDRYRKKAKLKGLPKKVVIIDRYNHVKHTYNSLSEASKALNMNRTTISRWCDNQKSLNNLSYQWG